MAISMPPAKLALEVQSCQILDPNQIMLVAAEFQVATNKSWWVFRYGFLTQKGLL